MRIFLDKNHGLLIREMLRRVNIQVYCHKDLGWTHNKSDVSIIHECAERNYVILSGDKSMERVPEERQAIIDGKCKLFMFDDSHKTRTEDWIASVLVGRQRIFEIVQKTRGPLFVTIKPCRVRGHIELPRFVEKAGAGWLAEDELLPVATPAIDHHSERPHPPRPQQTDLFPSAFH